MDIWLISPKSVTLLLQGIENKRERVGGRVPQKLSPYGAVSRHGSGPPSWTAAQRGGPRSPRFPQKVSPCDFKPLKTKGMVVGRVLQKMSPCRAVPRHGSGHPLLDRSATRRAAVAPISPKSVTLLLQGIENKRERVGGRVPQKLSPYGAVSRHGSGPPSWTAAQRGGPRSPRFPQKVSPCCCKALKTKGNGSAAGFPKNCHLMGPCRATALAPPSWTAAQRGGPRSPRFPQKVSPCCCKALKTKGNGSAAGFPKNCHLMGPCRATVRVAILLDRDAARRAAVAPISPKSVTLRFQALENKGNGSRPGSAKNVALSGRSAPRLGSPPPEPQRNEKARCRPDFPKKCHLAIASP
jgi:hypothetical protein